MPCDGLRLPAAEFGASSRGQLENLATPRALGAAPNETALFEAAESGINSAGAIAERHQRRRGKEFPKVVA